MSAIAPLAVIQAPASRSEQRSFTSQAECLLTTSVNFWLSAENGNGVVANGGDNNMLHLRDISAAILLSQLPHMPVRAVAGELI
jgi:hypothetical protein